MDPKDLNQLDPKLREAYERVMGTNVPSPAQDLSGVSQNQAPEQNIPTAAPSEPTPPPPAQASPISQATEPPPVSIDTSQSSQTPTSPPPVYQSYSAENGASPTSPQTTAVHHSSRFAISTPILVVLGVMFFAAYAALWIMVFGIKLF